MCSQISASKICSKELPRWFTLPGIRDLALIKQALPFPPYPPAAIFLGIPRWSRSSSRTVPPWRRVTSTVIGRWTWLGLEPARDTIKSVIYSRMPWMRPGATVKYGLNTHDHAQPIQTSCILRDTRVPGFSTIEPLCSPRLTPIHNRSVYGPQARSQTWDHPPTHVSR